MKDTTPTKVELLQHISELQDMLDRERKARTALEGDRIELQAKCGHLEQRLADVF